MSGFDEEVDFVVAGCGGGSMCAGLVMRRAGKSVLILEKTPFVGGTTAKSGGVMWIPNNPFMMRDGVEDSPEKAARYMDSVIGDHDDTPGTSRERRRAYIAQAPRMLDFLISQGIKFNRNPSWPDYFDEHEGSSIPGRTVVADYFDVNELGPWKKKLRKGFLELPTAMYDALMLPYFRRSWDVKKKMLSIGLRAVAAKLTGKHFVSAGAALQGRMLQAALRAGVEIRTEAPVKQLIVEHGAVTGVMTEKDGKPWRVRAKLGVLVNAGGFAQNQTMRDRYQPGTRAEWSNAAEGDTGEMILEMQRIGAALGQMDEMIGYQSTLPPGWREAYIKPPAQSLTAKPHAILVDQSGVRYQNEGGSYALYCQNMLARDKIVPAIPSWAVFDHQYIVKYMLAGTMPGAKKPESWTSEGYLKKADSIEQLAGLIHVDPATLKATVERWNGFCDKGHDEDFKRGERAYDRWLGDPFNEGIHQTLGKIAQGPFYAVPVVPGDVGTYGGVVTDTNARVLKADGTPIPGLYATGVSTASVMGRYYLGAGASIGPSFTWAYVAAKHAAGLDNQAI